MQKGTVSAVFLAGMIAFPTLCASQEISTKSLSKMDVHEGWQLAVQSYSFKEFTFFEAVDNTAALGLKYIEGSGVLQVSKARPNARFSEMLKSSQSSLELREEVKKKLKETGVQMVSYGVEELPNDEAKCREVFDFAKDMGIEIILSEPPAEAFDLIERLCEEYSIKVAIHNHAKPSVYWHPDNVLAVCKGRSKLIGACVDTGHWMRSGLNPVWALQQLEGRIISLHLKDRNGYGKKNTRDVPWGSGEANVKAMVTELDRQNFSGVVAIEYEYNWENSMPDIRQCVAYFNEVVSELKPTARAKD